MYKPLEDYISSLSPAEREQHRDLIEESVRRSRKNKENMDRIREDIAKLSEDWRELRVSQEGLLESIRKLNSKIIDLYMFVNSELFVRTVKPIEHVASMN